MDRGRGGSPTRARLLPSPREWGAGLGLAAILAALLLAAVLAAISVWAPRADAQPPAGDAADPFAALEGHRGPGAWVPPRALAVIPERHTGRLIRMVDVLVAIDPQLDDVATGAGLDGGRAIQVRTREARVPIFVRKNEANIGTLLQLPIGSRVEVRGVLVARGSRYLFLASDVRPSSDRRGAR